MSQRIVVKVGSNVLQQPNQKLDYNWVKELTEQIAELIHQENCQLVLVSSGAVGAGQELHDFSHVSENVKRQQMKAAVGQARLMQVYSQFFASLQITIAQVLVSRLDFEHQSNFLNLQNTLEGLLEEQSILPIINENDVVATEELKQMMGESEWFGDNDRLAVYIAALLHADQLIYLTTTPGVYEDYGSKSPQIIPQIKQITPQLLQQCLKQTSSSGTGGMLSKVKSAGLASSLGIDTYVASGREPHVLKRLWKKEKLGTHFPANGSNPSTFKHWEDQKITQTQIV